MSNTATPGFKFRRQRNGGTNPLVEIRTVATGNSLGIYKGDPLKLVNDGTVIYAAAGDNVYAVADGVENYFDGAVNRRGTYLPASTAWGTVRERRSQVRCILARDALFEVDCDDAVTATSEASYEALINENCNSHTGAGGSTTTGLSSYVLDISTHTTNTGTSQWRIVDIARNVNQDFASTYVKLIVEANLSDEPQYSTTGV